MTITNKKYLIYRSAKLLIFMSPLQAQLIYKYNDHIFFDCTFYVAPQFSYQVVTIRIHNIFEEAYYIVGYALMSDKSMSTYIVIK